ncbi:MAG: hypothetical protein ACF8CQ_01635 [Rhodopirellula sp. JB044]|uniref:hypothetical protein n=1 Tax=Rhodopirellula sp. JB044 TaxID=3342844 RepID=UPI00370B1395
MGESSNHDRLQRNRCLTPASAVRLALGLLITIIAAVSPAQIEADSPQTSAQYVLLNNDSVLTGTVWRRGSSVIVRRGNQSELTLRADQVVAVEDDLMELYQSRIRSQRRRTLPSLNDLIKDLRWCIDNGLPDQATRLLIQIHSVAPNHPVALQLETRLRRMNSTEEAASIDSTQDSHFATATHAIAFDEPTIHRGNNPIQPASHLVERPSIAAEPEHTHTSINTLNAPASLHPFTSRVQPILMARCASCHHESSTASTQWHLTLPARGAMRVTQRGSIANFNATLPYCQPKRPADSELIEMATRYHGGDSTSPDSARSNQQPPIAEHEVALLRTLKDWIATIRPTSPDATSASSGEAQKAITTDQPSPLNRIQPSEVAAFLSSPPDNEATKAIDPEAIDPETMDFDSTAGHSSTEPNSGRPVRLPIVENPNDVRHFNRETRLRRILGLSG